MHVVISIEAMAWFKKPLRYLDIKLGCSKLQHGINHSVFILTSTAVSIKAEFFHSFGNSLLNEIKQVLTNLICAPFCLSFSPEVAVPLLSSKIKESEIVARNCTLIKKDRYLRFGARQYLLEIIACNANSEIIFCSCLHLRNLPRYEIYIFISSS